MEAHPSAHGRVGGGDVAHSQRDRAFRHMSYIAAKLARFEVVAENLRFW